MSSNIRIQRICDYCNKEFTAKTTRTRYCSHLCNSRAYKANLKNTKIIKSNNETIQKVTQPIEQIKKKEILSVKDAALLLGCSTKTIYRLIKKQNLKAFNLSERLTRIKKIDLDRFISLPKQTDVIESKEHINLSDCYNIGEIQHKFNVSQTALQLILKREGVTKYKKGKFTYVEKNIIEDLLL